MLSALLSRHFWITAYAMLAAGLWLPGDYSAWHAWVPIFLGGILYFTCLKIRFQEIRDNLRLNVLLRVAALMPIRLFALPLVCYAAARAVAPDWATGVLVLAVMPAGFSSIAFTDLYGGNRMLALLLVLATSVVCPLTVPLLVEGLGAGGHLGGAALAHRVGYLLAVLMTPFALAQVTRALAGDFVERHRERWSYGAILSSCLMIFVSVSSNRHAWEGIPLSGLALPLGLGCMVSAIGFAGGMLVRLFVSRADAIAFTCGEIWINNGLAIAFASEFFRGEAKMVLPAVLMQVPIVATMALYGQWTRRMPRDETPTGTT